MTINHVIIAADLDEAFHSLARIGRAIGPLTAIAGTLDRAVINAFEAVQAIREHLDHAAVAAAGETTNAFIRRDLKPMASTVAAVAAARRRAQQADSDARSAKQARHASNGRAGWGVRCERERSGAAPGNFMGPHFALQPTGDDDRRAFLLSGVVQGSSSASPHAAREPASTSGPTQENGALTGLQSEPQAVYPDAAV